MTTKQRTYYGKLPRKEKNMFNLHERLVLQDPITCELHDFALTKVGMILAIRWIASKQIISSNDEEIISRNYHNYIYNQNVRIAANNFVSSPENQKDLLVEKKLNKTFYENALCGNIASFLTRFFKFDDEYLVSQNVHYFDEKCKKEFDGFIDYIYKTIGCEDYVPKHLYSKCFVDKYGDKKYAPKNDIFSIKDVLIHKELKKFVGKCEDCGEKYLNINDVKFPLEIRGIDGYCSYCAIHLHNYEQCSDCGQLIDSDSLIYVENTDSYICDDCLEYGDYRKCERCGAIIYTPDDCDHIWTEDECFYCCVDCAQRHGYHYSDSRDAWIDYDEDEFDDDNVLADYHSTHFAKLGLGYKNAVHWLGSGSEIEVCGEDPNSLREFWNETIYSGHLQHGKYGALEHDGSVTAEIVMQPMTEKEFNKFDFESMFNDLIANGYTGHDNGNCGSHVHLSNGYLGYTKAQIMNNAKKVCAFFENYWDDMVKFSRRTDEQLHWCNKFGFDITKDTDFDELSYDRYHAVNLTNLFTSRRGTIEIRIPRGTLNAKTFRATTDFLRHIVRNAKNISWDNIDNLKLWFKGITNPNTIEYLKSRKCFEGEF